MVTARYLFFLNGLIFFAWSRTASVAFLVAFTVLSLTFFSVPFTSGIFIFGSLNTVSFPDSFEKIFIGLLLITVFIGVAINIFMAFITRAPGWVTIPEIQLVRMCMSGESGHILEVGSCAGRLFSGLHPHKPHWRYTALDRWNGAVPLLLDLKESSTDPSNWDPRYLDEYGHCDTQEIFQKHCGLFAEQIKADFREHEFDQQYDVVSVGMNMRRYSLDDWYSIYAKVDSLVKPGGWVIARNLDSSTATGDHLRTVISGRADLQMMDQIHNQYPDHRRGCCACIDGSSAYSIH